MDDFYDDENAILLDVKRKLIHTRLIQLFAILTVNRNLAHCRLRGSKNAHPPFSTFAFLHRQKEKKKNYQLSPLYL